MQIRFTELTDSQWETRPFQKVYQLHEQIKTFNLLSEMEKFDFESFKSEAESSRLSLEKGA